MIKSLLYALCLLVVASVAVPAFAQTADGATPAEEDHCDLEAGAAYGLCVAYCEAMDCHLASDTDAATEPNASATACDRVGTRFTNVTGREVPCVNAVTCPCFAPSSWEIQEAGDTWKQFADQLFNPASTTCTDNASLTRLLEIEGAVEEGNVLGAAVFAETSECHVYYGDAEEPVDVFALQPDEVEACRSLLQTAAAAGGVTCTP